MRDQPTAVPHQLIWNAKNSLQCVSFLPDLNAKQMCYMAEHHVGCQEIASQMVLHCFVSKRCRAFCLMAYIQQHSTEYASLPSNRRNGGGAPEMSLSCLVVSYCYCISLRVVVVQKRHTLWSEKVQKPGKYVKLYRTSASWAMEFNYVGGVSLQGKIRASYTGYHNNILHLRGSVLFAFQVPAGYLMTLPFLQQWFSISRALKGCHIQVSLQHGPWGHGSTVQSSVQLSLGIDT